MARGGARPGAGAKKGACPAKVAELKLDLINTLREKGFDPVAALVEVHLDAKREYKKRLDPESNPKGFGAVGMMQVAESSAAHLMEFVYPKRKSVELTGAEGTDLFQSFNDLVREIAKDAKPSE